MAILYKHFNQARTVFWALFICFLFIAPGVFAQDTLFTVEDVEVDVTADNALNARDQAFVQAQGKAFAILAERMLSESEVQNFTPPDPSVISTMIKDYEVTKEQLSNVRYIGTYIFRFKDSKVRQYFSGSGVQYTDVASRPVLVIPYLQSGSKMILWSSYNPWLEAWNRAQNLSGIVPVIVPLGDVQDVGDIGDGKTLTYDEEHLRSMLGRYGAGEAVLVVAMPDENLSRISGDGDPAVGSVTVQIYRTDRARPEYTNQIVQSAVSGQTKAQLFDMAVDKVNDVLQKDWKSRTLVSAAQGNTIYARVPFKNLQQWVTTRKVLEKVHGINQIDVKSLSPNGAEVEISFQGSESRLRLALQQANITLSTPSFRSGRFTQGVNARNQMLVYELYLNSFTPQQSNYVGEF